MDIHGYPWIWIIHGLSMDYPWIIHGLSTDYPRDFPSRACVPLIAPRGREADWQVAMPAGLLTSARRRRPALPTPTARRST
eukprot:6777209-Prymnesium_polylepis.1